ncbi:MAG TPA: sigma-E factor negative regulatory protein [Steroidobacteraceae bacterium]|nr:sigma-E factor negative regulatory protein [Steroidobacteraceae bacterium]
MTDRIKEQLSAFLDGELPDPESALLLKRLERDDDLRGALSRYSLIGAVLRSDGDVPAARHVAARVSAAIAREPARSAALPRVRRRDEILRASAGLAVAAGVALGAVLLVQQVVSQDPVAPAAVVAQTEMLPVQPVQDPDEAAGSYVTPPAVDAPAGIPPAELANYLVAHYGYASPLVRRSVGAGLISDDESALAEALPPAESTEP